MLIREALQRGQPTEASGLLMRSTASSPCAWRGEAKGVRQSAKNESVPFPGPARLTARRGAIKLRSGTGARYGEPCAGGPPGTEGKYQRSTP